MSKGEWWFRILEYPLPELDLVKYQSLLRSIKDQYASRFQDLGDGESIIWCDDEKLPPEYNVFARFTYKCDESHAHLNPDSDPKWLLFWDPTVVSEELKISDVRCDCAPWDFMVLSNSIHQKLVKEFPDHFEAFCEEEMNGDLDTYNDDDPYRRDYFDPYEEDYQHGDYYDYASDNHDGAPDYTACNVHECGYCGNCDY